jgi:hypothetical protein
MYCHGGATEQVGCVLYDSVVGVGQIACIDLVANAVPPTIRCGDGCCASSQKWVEDSISHEGEHPDQAGREFDRIRGWMMSG